MHKDEKENSIHVYSAEVELCLGGSPKEIVSLMSRSVEYKRSKVTINANKSLHIRIMANDPAAVCSSLKSIAGEIKIIKDTQNFISSRKMKEKSSEKRGVKT